MNYMNFVRGGFGVNHCISEAWGLESVVRWYGIGFNGA